MYKYPLFGDFFSYQSSVLAFSFMILLLWLFPFYSRGSVKHDATQAWWNINPNTNNWSKRFEDRGKANQADFPKTICFSVV